MTFMIWYLFCHPWNWQEPVLEQISHLKGRNCDEVIKNDPSKTCGRQPFKNLTLFGLFNFYKAYLPQIWVHSWIRYIIHNISLVISKLLMFIWWVRSNREIFKIKVGEWLNPVPANVSFLSPPIKRFLTFSWGVEMVH